MKLIDDIQITQKIIAENLASFFTEKKVAVRRIDGLCVAIVEQVADLTLRPSKRIRPFLVGLGYEMVKGKRKKEKGALDETVLSAMLAIELFHSFALIHDDIMDEDVERRGGPTVHEQFRLSAVSFQLSAKKTAHFGESMAILAGDLALVWAEELMNKTDNEKTIRLFSKMKEEVAFGQVLDVMHQAGYKNIAQDKINELKTAWYTVVRPLQIGAALAGASEATLTVLARFGVPVGKLFQLKDDLMDNQITQKKFDQQVVPLQKEAHIALAGLKISHELKTSLEDLARFVIERTS
ncbi:polyprenyl synthetase family protein [Candidatus Gottesmanbacteria bacterium]|nr:polyprenyl synthetase family protein [Candidatus Gottesmanbacteria bacterium]